MRALNPWIVLVLLVCLASGTVRADEPPEPAKDPPKEVQPDAKDPAEDAAKPDGEPEVTVEKLDPRQGMVEMSKAVRGLPRARQLSARRGAATAWLTKWEASGQKPEGTDALYLAQLYQAVTRWPEAVAHFESLVADGVPEGLKSQGAAGLAGLLANPRGLETIGKRADAVVSKLIQYLETPLTAAMAVRRGAVNRSLATYYGRQGNDAKSLSHNMQAAVLNPALAATVARSVLRDMMTSTHALDGYAPSRARAETAFAKLKALAVKNQDTLKARLALWQAEAADERRIKSAQDAFDRAERGVTNMARYMKPFALLGTPAAEWTSEHAFGDLKTLAQARGKVVVVDFWATWCHWCIRSFPAIRDILKDYADKDLLFVGVTATSSSVYEARYSLDDDLAERAEAGKRARPVARLVRGEQEPDPEKGIFAAEAYRVREIEAIGTFIKNHEMTWPVLMIDKAEPAAKYALMGWPHAVVIDKQGRIRYFKSGALLRDRPAAIKKFRALLDDLLAEE